MYVARLFLLFDLMHSDIPRAEEQGQGQGQGERRGEGEREGKHFSLSSIGRRRFDDRLDPRNSPRPSARLPRLLITYV